LRSGGRIAVQLERHGKGHTAIGGTDVIDVARVTASTVLGINQVNDVVKRSGLTPALVSPVHTGRRTGEHAGEVPGSANARSRERRTGIGVSPSVAAVG
jgi:hypothetical protein